jgi:hypothetical protein
MSAVEGSQAEENILPSKESHKECERAQEPAVEREGVKGASLEESQEETNSQIAADGSSQKTHEKRGCYLPNA